MAKVPADDDQRALLAGYRVLEVGGHASAYAGWLLSALGADVDSIRIANAEYAGCESAEFTDALGATFDHHKMRCRSGTMTSAELSDDIRCADLVVLDLLGLGHDQSQLEGNVRAGCRAAGVDLIVLCGEDLDGRGIPWTDFTAAAGSGLLSLGGHPGSVPVTTRAALAGYSTAVHAVVAALALKWYDAVHGRHRRRNRLVEVNGTAGLLAALENSVQFLEMEGVLRQGRGATIEAGHGVYRSSDGWVHLVAAGLGDAAWARLVQWLAELNTDLSDGRWRDPEYRRSQDGKDRFRSIFESVSRTRTALDLEEEAQLRKIPLSAVRSLEEVVAHPQLEYRGAFSGSPEGGLLSPVRIAAHIGPSTPTGVERPRQSSRPDPSADPTKPLAGMRILDFTWVGAGPFTTRILGDLGAEIVKVESADRPDTLRLTPPFQAGQPGLNSSGYFANRNAGKKSVELDLGSPDGRRTALDLARDADVVINSFSVGVMTRLGLGAEVIAEVNPAAVYVDMPLHGTTGPHAHHVGFGGMINAAGGYHALSGGDDNAPVGTGTNFPDHVPNPLHCVAGILAAAVAGRRSNQARGHVVEVAQFESAVCFLGPELMLARRGNATVDAAGNTLLSVPSGIFTAVDGHLIAVDIVSDRQWQNLAGLLDLDVDAVSWGQDVRSVRRDSIHRSVERLTGTLPAEVLVARLQNAGIPAQFVRGSREVLESGGRSWHTVLSGPGFGSVPYSLLPLTIDGKTPVPNGPAPVLGADTAAVLNAPWSGVTGRCSHSVLNIEQGAQA